MKVTMKALRVNAGLSQKQAAESIGVTKRTISNWEQHKTFPTIAQMRKMCEIYHCGAGDIFLPNNVT